MNTENVRQDGGEETQIYIYLPDDGRNFKDKIPRNVLLNKIYSHNKTTCYTCEVFKKLKLHSPKRFVRISLAQIDSKLNSKPYEYLHICSKDVNNSVRINVTSCKNQLKNLSAFKIVADHETRSLFCRPFALTAGDPL